MESTKEFVVELENIDGENGYEFLNDAEGKALWSSAEELKGSFTIVTVNKNREIDRFSDLDGNRFIVNYDDVGKYFSFKLIYDENKFYEVNSVDDARFDNDEKMLVGSNGINTKIKSSVIVVKVMLDDKGNKETIDDEYMVEYHKGYDELKNANYDYAIVIKDSASNFNNDAKYVLIFEKVETEELRYGVITETRLMLNGLVELLIDGSDSYLIDEDKTKEEIVNNLINNAAPASGEKKEVEDDGTGMNFIPLFVEKMNSVKLKELDRIFIYEEKEYFIAIRGLPEREAWDDTEFDG